MREIVSAPPPHHPPRPPLVRSKWTVYWFDALKDHVAAPLDGEVERYLTASIALFEVIEDDLLPLKPIGIQVNDQAARVHRQGDHVVLSPRAGRSLSPPSVTSTQCKNDKAAPRNFNHVITSKVCLVVWSTRRAGHAFVLEWVGCVSF